MTPLLIFALQFVTVFALGAQSLNVNGGHYRLAAITSIIISLGSLGGTWLTIVRNEPDAANIAAFIVGSVLGITSAMRAHPTLVRWLGRRDQFEHHLDMVNATNARPTLDTDPPASATQRGAERYAHEVINRIKGSA